MFQNKKTTPEDIQAWAKSFDFSDLAQTMNLGDFSLIDFMMLSDDAKAQLLNDYQSVLDQMIAQKQRAELEIE
jgi:hypothetical protein